MKVYLDDSPDAGDFRPGDPPPSGYVAWHVWAEVQDRAGLRQERCGVCGLWKFPQERSARVIVSLATDSAGMEVRLESPVCKGCESKRAEAIRGRAER